MTKEEFESLLNKYINGQCTEEEKEYIEQFDRNLLFRNVAELEDSKVKQLEDRYLTSIRNKLNESTRKSKSVPLWRPYLLGIAASLLILFVVSIYVLLPDNTQRSLPNVFLSATDMRVIQNTDTTDITITMPDQSRIVLEPGAVIRYKEDGFAKDKREVILEGIAFFDIKRDTKRPFLVYANEVVTKVLGTSFTIRAEKDASDVTVCVKSGKVSVSAVNNKGDVVKETLLTPNQKAVVNLQQKTIASTVVEKPERIMPAEQVKKLRFDNASATEVFLALEQMYGIDILFDENTFSGCKIRTSVSEGEMFNRLEIICNAIGATYTVEGTYIAIHGSGCN